MLNNLNFQSLQSISRTAKYTIRPQTTMLLGVTLSIFNKG